MEYSFISSMAEFQGKLLLAGSIRFEEDPDRTWYVVQWDGSRLEPFDGDFPPAYGSPSIRSFYTTDREIWAAGSYSSDHTSAVLLAHWAGEGWTDRRFGTGLCGGDLSRIAPYRDGFVVIGAYLLIEGTYAGYIAYWDGEAWQTFGPAGEGLDLFPTAFFPMEEALYVSGYFGQTVAGQPLSPLAKWNGASWSTIPGSPDGRVRAMVKYDGAYVVGGDFRTSGADSVWNIARWDGESWEPMGVGFPDPVSSLCVYEGELHAGGGFWRAEGNVVAHVAKWENGHWKALGDGVRGSSEHGVSKLVVFQDQLVASGNFWRAGTRSASCIAAWDGVDWTPLGDPPWPEEAWVTELEVWKGVLVAVADWYEADHEIRFAMWDGRDWRLLQIPDVGEVREITVYKGNLVLGGRFECEDGERGLLILWDGEDLIRLGSGIYGDWMTTMAEWRGDLYLGGAFRYAGGKPSRNIAVYSGEDIVPHAPLANLTISPNPVRDGASIAFFLPTAQEVTLEVFNILGRRQGSLASGWEGSGERLVDWDGRDSQGRLLPSGVYFVKLETDGRSRSRKVHIIR
jgi:hypothetical protein